MKIFTFEEALHASVRYFNGDELAAKVFVDKYALKAPNGDLLEDTPEAMHRRIAKEFARIEKQKFKKPYTEEEIFALLDRFKFIIPQGSPMFGIGNDHQVISLSNCFVVEPPQDSYGAIMRCDEQLVQISKRRGGTGTNLNALRPAGSATTNAAKCSTGVPSFAERYSHTIREVGQEGRRGALMLNLNIHHPDCVIIPEADDLVWKKPEKVIIKGRADKNERDIETLSCYYDPKRTDFVSMKLDRKKVTGANVSVLLTDEFLNAVEEGEDYEQRFPIKSRNPKIRKKVNARNAWKKIIHMAWQSAEPGLLFWDRILNYNAVDCYADLGFETVSTNPCSEIPLCPNDSCRLLLINLYSFVVRPFSKMPVFHDALFRSVTKVAQRLMDDLIDLEIEKIDQIIAKIKKDPEEEVNKRVELELWLAVREKCVQGRRTGLGFTGLGDCLAALNLPYDSDQSMTTVDNICRDFKHSAFQASAEMAEELGAFPIWDWDREKNSEFLLQIKKENPELYHYMAKVGRRNIGLLTLAPAGSVSTQTQTTSGGEPVFSLGYDRMKKVNPNDKNVTIDFVDGQGDSWQKFTVYHHGVATWMKVTGETDVKKSPYWGSTAPDIDWEKRVKLQSIIQKHLDHAISSTVNLPESATEEDVAKIYTAAWKMGCKGITVYREGCRSGVLISKQQEAQLTKTDAPKRPECLEGEIFATSYKREKLYVAVGRMGRDPYEVFTGTNDKDEIKNAKGTICKNERGKYIFKTEAGETYKLQNGHNDENADALTRMISTALRHGSDIGFVVHQLEKTEGDLLSFAKVVARVLKKYIADGTKVAGDSCPSCGNSLVRESGCSSCKNCGWSKCL